MSESSGIIVDGDNETNETKDSPQIQSESWQSLSNGPSEDTETANIEIISSPEKTENSQINSNEFINVENENEIFEQNLELALKHKSEGNKLYKLKQYEQALDAYSLAIRHCPDAPLNENDDNDDDDENKEEDEPTNEHLSVFYANRSACYIAMEEWEESVEDCTLSIQHNKKNIKAYWRRAKSYEKLEKYYDAKCDYNSILAIEPNHEISKANLERIEPFVQRQFEQQKEEVMGKLKGFANWGLGKLGLSLDNFETKQDPQTGAYNINFKQ